MTSTDKPEQQQKSPAGGLASRFRRVALDTRPLAFPVYRRVLVGQGASFVGTMVTGVTIPVQIYALSHSSFYVGLAGLAGFVPIVVFGLYGGAIADAVDRRLLYLWSSLVTWVVTIALLVQTLLDVRSVPLILILVAVQGAGFATSSSTRGAIIPRIVPGELVPAANTLNFTVGNAGQVLGPLVAGVLVDLPHGFAFAYGADALLFTVSLYSTFRLPPIRPVGVPTRRGVLAVFDGLRFISGNPILLMSFGVDIAAMVLAMPRALFPEAAAARFHGGVGLLYASIAIGSVVGGLCSGWIGRVRRQGVALTVAVAGWAAAITVAGYAHTLWLAVLLLAVAGSADLVSSVYRQTILQTYAPDDMRGRMQGVFTVVVAGGPRLGDLRAGAMASATTLSIAWSGSAVLCIVLVIAGGLAVRPFWRYDTRAATASGGAIGSGSRQTGDADSATSTGTDSNESRGSTGSTESTRSTRSTRSTGRNAGLDSTGSNDSNSSIGSPDSNSSNSRTGSNSDNSGNSGNDSNSHSNGSDAGNSNA